MTKQRGLWDPQERADAGMTQAAEHADRVHGGDWQEQALAAVLLALPKIAQPFIWQDVVGHAGCGVPEPPDGRAWGAVATTARRCGAIVPTGGFRKDKWASPKAEYVRGTR